MPRTAEHLQRWQFRPGQSGNPEGRGAGRKSFETLVSEVLDEETEREINGQKTLASQREHLARYAVKRAFTPAGEKILIEILKREWPTADLQQLLRERLAGTGEEARAELARGFAQLAAAVDSIPIPIELERDDGEGAAD